MKFEIYCIKDNVAGFLQPTFELYEPAALRNFAYAVNQPGLMNFKPEDYSLWHLGSLDTKTGEILPIIPEIVTHGNDVFEEKKI